MPGLTLLERSNSFKRLLLKESSKVGLIDQIDVWLAMLKDRNLSTHDYVRINQGHYCEMIQSTYLPLEIKLGKEIEDQVKELSGE